MGIFLAGTFFFARSRQAAKFFKRFSRSRRGTELLFKNLSKTFAILRLCASFSQDFCFVRERDATKFFFLSCFPDKNRRDACSPVFQKLLDGNVFFARSRQAAKFFFKRFSRSRRGTELLFKNLSKTLRFCVFARVFSKIFASHGNVMQRKFSSCFLERICFPCKKSLRFLWR